MYGLLVNLARISSIIYNEDVIFFQGWIDSKGNQLHKAYCHNKPEFSLQPPTILTNTVLTRTIFQVTILFICCLAYMIRKKLPGANVPGRCKGLTGNILFVDQQYRFVKLLLCHTLVHYLFIAAKPTFACTYCLHRDG